MLISLLLLVTTPFAAEEKKPTDTQTKQTERYGNLELFQKVLHFVELNYVEETKNQDLIYGAIKGMLETLDPHSNFLPPEIYKDMKVDTSGKYGGIGIEIGMKDNVLTIIAPIEDTPAYRAGLKPGDKIVKINGEATKGMNITQAISKMRGKKGSEIELSIYREGFNEIKEVKIVREMVKVQSVKQDEIEPGFGYVRLSQFNENAAGDVKKAIEKLSSGKELKGLVLDLRANPGGLLDQAVDVASLFLDEGVIVSTIGRDKNQKEIKYAKKGNARKDLPLAVLVNSSSASASEIVAGALQDHHRALIIGQPTFGKGSVQSVIELGPDLGLKLTIARYYTPSGKSIQEKGVQPDIILEEYDQKLLAQAKKTSSSMRERDLRGHMKNTDKGLDEDDDERLREMKMEEKASRAAKKRDKSSDADDDFVVKPYNPKEDYQVREAINYLRGFDVFKKMNEKKAPAQTDQT